MACVFEHVRICQLMKELNPGRLPCGLGLSAVLLTAFVLAYEFWCMFIIHLPFVEHAIAMTFWNQHHWKGLDFCRQSLMWLSFLGGFEKSMEAELSSWQPVLGENHVRIGFVRSHNWNQLCILLANQLVLSDRATL